MTRLEFSRKAKQAIRERANSHCEGCGAVLKPSEGEVDHILPCALGGEPTVANGRLLCRVCHVGKTAGDVRQVRKADRQRDKSSGAIKPKSKLAASKEPKPNKWADPFPTLPRSRLFVEAQKS